MSASFLQAFRYGSWIVVMDARAYVDQPYVHPQLNLCCTVAIMAEIDADVV